MKILIIALLVLFPISVKAEQLFFETLYDVPVMEGLIEIPDMAMTFDKPNGRISQAGAMMKNISASQIQAFYAEALIQLGWKSIKRNEYVREGETLVISYEGDETVKFLLKPL